MRKCRLFHLNRSSKS